MVRKDGLISGLLICIVAAFALTPAGASWAFPNSFNATHTRISNVNSTVINITLHNISGTSNVSDYFAAGTFNAGFTGINVTKNNLTEIPFWIDSSSITATTAFMYINVSTLSASDYLDLYHNVGNSPGQTYGDASDGNKTFPRFWNFTTDTSGWTSTVGTWIVSNGQLWTPRGATDGGLITNQGVQAEDNYIVESRINGSVGSTERGTLVSHVGTLNYLTNGYASFATSGNEYLRADGSDIAAAGTAATSASTWYRFKQSISKNTVHSGYFMTDQRNILSNVTGTTDTAQTGTSLGIVSSNANSDNFTVDFVLTYNKTSPMPSAAGWSTTEPAPVSWTNSHTNNNSLLLDIDSGETVDFTIYSIQQIINYCASGDGATCTYTAYTGASNITLSHQFNTLGTTFYNISVQNVSGSFNASVNWTIRVNSFTVPNLLTPANGSSQSFTFPPQTQQVNLTWISSPARSSHVQVSADTNFNIIELDTTTDNRYLLASLGNGTHFWRVQEEQTSDMTTGSYSSIFSFTLSQGIPSLTGTTISGVVYELINGVQTPIENAVVTITNSSLTWSNTMITGSNGYFQFGSLSNSTTYVLKASRQDIYSDSANYYQTTGLGTQSILYILMQRCVSGFNCFYNQQYTEFIVQDWFGNTKYAGVTATVYKDGAVTPMLSGTTGTDGKITFLLIKDQKYSITFINSTAGISTTFEVTPSEPFYYVIVTVNTNGNWFTGTNTQSGSIITGVTSNTIGSTGWINVTYEDDLAQTTGLIIYINQTNKTLATSPQIVVQSFNAGALSNASHNFSVANPGGKSYLINIEAQHTTFGSVVRSYGIHFNGSPSTAADFISDVMKAWIALGFMIFIGAIFGESRRAQGAGVVCILGWVFLGMGWFNYFGVIRIGAGLTLATILVFFWNMNEKRSYEGMQ